GAAVPRSPVTGSQAVDSRPVPKPDPISAGFDPVSCNLPQNCAAVPGSIDTGNEDLDGH
ncbi:unnamed protein product, partial [marine sediment metagenome]